MESRVGGDGLSSSNGQIGMGEKDRTYKPERRRYSPGPSKYVLKTRRLKAVWARDTLGLSGADYCKC